MRRRRERWRWWRVAGILLPIEGVWQREKVVLCLFCCRRQNSRVQESKRRARCLSYDTLLCLPFQMSDTSRLTEENKSSQLAGFLVAVT